MNMPAGYSRSPAGAIWLALDGINLGYKQSF